MAEGEKRIRAVRCPEILHLGKKKKKKSLFYGLALILNNRIEYYNI